MKNAITSIPNNAVDARNTNPLLRIGVIAGAMNLFILAEACLNTTLVQNG